MIRWLRKRRQIAIRAERRRQTAVDLRHVRRLVIDAVAVSTDPDVLTPLIAAVDALDVALAVLVPQPATDIDAIPTKGAK